MKRPNSEYLLVVALFTAVSLIANVGYFHCGHVWDDLQHLRRIGEIEAGRDSWWRFLTGYHNEHQLFLWKLWYAGTWKVFGLAPVAWHIMIALGQALGALGLYGTLRGIGVRLIPAATAGCLWAGATIGGFDSPLIWIAASHLAFGVSWMLLASWVASRATDDNGMLPSIGCAVFVAASVATMSAMALLFPLVIGGLWFSKLAKSPWQRLKWLAPALIPVVVVVSMQLYMSSLGMLKAPTDSGGEVGPAAIAKVLAVGGNALANTLAGLAFENTTLSAAFGVVVLAVVLGLMPEVRRVALWMLPPTIVYLLMVATARSDFPVDKFAGMGRFQYLPILAWCAIIGVVCGNGLERLKSRRVGFATCCFGLVGIYLICQVTLAHRSVALANEVNAPSEGPWKANIALVRSIASGGSMTLPDIPVPSRSFHQYLSGMVAYATGRGQKLEVRAWPDMNMTEIDAAIQLLRGISSETSVAWADTLALGKAFREFFLLMSDRGASIKLPNIQVPIPKTKPMLLSQVQQLVAPELTRSVPVVDQITVKEVEVAISQLSSVEHPIARELLGILPRKSR